MESTSAQDASTYLNEISSHRKRVRILLLVMTLAALGVVILSNSPYKNLVIGLLGATVVYHFVYWYLLVPHFRSKNSILVAVTVYNILYTICTIFIPWLRFLPLILLISTIVIFDSMPIIIMTVIELVVYNFMAFLIYTGQLSVDGFQFEEYLYFNLVAATVGVIAAITTFEVSERERRMVRLEEVNDIKSVFINLISRNLNTPMAPMLDYIRVLEEQINLLPYKSYAEFQTIQDVIAKLNTSANQVKGIVANIVNVAAIQSGQLKLQYQEFNLYEMVSYLINNTFIQAAKTKGLVLVLNANSDKNLVITADKQQIVNLMFYIIDNAIKYTDIGSVTVTCKHDGENAKITVVDSGRGIPDDFRKKIFSPFVQANSISSEESGVGFGLYASRIIVSAHKGDISVDSMVDKGSSFTIILPLKPPAS